MHARQINAVAIAFQRIRIGVGRSSFGVEADAVRVQERQIGAIAGHREDEIVLQRDIAFGRRERD